MESILHFPSTPLILDSEVNSVLPKENHFYPEELPYISNKECISSEESCIQVRSTELQPEPIPSSKNPIHQSEYSQWSQWFINHPRLPIPTPSTDPTIDNFLSESPYSTSKNSEFLKLQYNPTTDPFLNQSQLHLFSIFLDLLHNPNDAVALSCLVQDQFLCTLSILHEDCIERCSVAGDYFRLLLFYFYPSIAFSLDCHYCDWEKEMNILFQNPMEFLSSYQMICFIEQLQQTTHHSIIWFYLTIIHAFSLYSSSFPSSFHSYLLNACSFIPSVSFSSLLSMTQSLPSITQESITTTFKQLSSSLLFACPLVFSDVVGPVITSESRYKKLLLHAIPLQPSQFILLDIRKHVIIKNELINSDHGFIETTFYSTVSPNHHTSLHYIHIPYSSSYSEENQYYSICKEYSHPIILLADQLTEANLVSLLLQKAKQPYVCIAAINHPSYKCFLNLLDILLTTDDSSTKQSLMPSKSLFSSWSWWKGWKKSNDSNMSSSDFYHSASLEDSSSKDIIQEKGIEHHSKQYFTAIHSCLDKVVVELDEAAESTVIHSSLLSIVQSLLYIHSITCLAEEELSQVSSTIETYHKKDQSISVNDNPTQSISVNDNPIQSISINDNPIQSISVNDNPIQSLSINDNPTQSISSLHGSYLLVLSQHRFLLLASTSYSKDTSEEDDHIDVDEEKEAEILLTIIHSLEKNGFCSVDEVTNKDNLSYIVKLNKSLDDIENLNILVNEDNHQQEHENQSPIIHIQFNSNENLYFKVDYTIFVVNEIMKRIGNVN